MKKYDVSSIEALDAITHIRERSSFYLGDTSSATQLLVEIIDNSLDEVEAGGAKNINIEIGTTKDNNLYFSVDDDGRGLPFDVKLPLEKDPPVLITHTINTSGKFRKGMGKDETSYKIAVGLHGIGLTAVAALSKYLEINIYRDGKHGTYKFFPDGRVVRTSGRKKAGGPYSTHVLCVPDQKYFDKSDLDLETIKNRLLIASCKYPNLNITININGEMETLKTTKEEFLETCLGNNVRKWYKVNTNKDIETCDIYFGWADEDSPKTSSFSTVNLAPVVAGPHILKATNTIKEVFYKLSKKYGKSFEPVDILSWLRIYIDLMIVENHFDSQTKERLSKKSDISVMDNIDKQIETLFKKEDEKEILRLLEKFESYRKAIQSKKLSTHGRKRGLTKFTKLQDCDFSHGELIIGEGASAVGGLAQIRDSKKHAILPLKGVIPNVITSKDALQHTEVKEIIQALGCGIGSACDISKLRYDKIILAADADPAGYFITALLITLFAYYTPDIIKNGKLYVCKTPLFGIKKRNKFVPLWTQGDLKKARKNNENITRIKGLGEFNPEDLKVFTLDENTRVLIKVDWSENYQRLFDLMSSPEERRQLFLNKWEI